MTEQTATGEHKVGSCMLHNWAEERAVAALDQAENRFQIRRQGHKGILTLDQDTKMETVTTHRTDFLPPKGPGVRERGIRSELLEKHIALMIREKIQAEQNSPPAESDFCSTTQRDFCVEGFVPLTPELTQAHDYKSDAGVTFWSENRHHIHGVTAVQTLEAPFRKSAKFSTPISERLDEPELPPDN
ncbi:sperm associated antigen 8 [Labrus mixtus]|uniref:sperm associated antigen 8 n=1 Tax=Labrus mixtus TaxID=508554 RepID=UPI0029C09BD2|nr:sperm associated antigen 8 [Labrus mixtus]XP_060917001.1 sperm associated antigen 8 [Labrus mixtus]